MNLTTLLPNTCNLVPEFNRIGLPEGSCSNIFKFRTQIACAFYYRDESVTTQIFQGRDCCFLK